MQTRSYVSSVRSAAAAEKRERVVEAASRYLREDAGISGFSLEAVAKAAGVTRLTVYNQFGSRRGLLEAVFDEIAQRGGLFQLADAMTAPDPRRGLDMVIEIFCRFWSSDPALGRLHDAMAIDTEFAVALTERNERRRQTIGVLMARIIAGPALEARRRDATDLIFCLTSCATYRMLGHSRTIEETVTLISKACADAIDGQAPA